MPMLILMLGTVKDSESMVDLAKDMVYTEAMVFNKQHTDSEVIPIMVDTDVLMEAILDTEPMELLMEVTDDSGEGNLSSRNELCSILHSSYSIEQYKNRKLLPLSINLHQG